MVAMDGKYRYGNINIGILVIDMIESPNKCHVTLVHFIGKPVE